MPSPVLRSNDQPRGSKRSTTTQDEAAPRGERSASTERRSSSPRAQCRSATERDVCQDDSNFDQITDENENRNECGPSGEKARKISNQRNTFEENAAQEKEDHLLCNKVQALPTEDDLVLKRVGPSGAERPDVGQEEGGDMIL